MALDTYCCICWINYQNQPSWRCPVVLCHKFRGSANQQVLLTVSRFFTTTVVKVAHISTTFGMQYQWTLNDVKNMHITWHDNMLPCNVMCGCYLLPHHTVVWWDNLVYCVFVCTVTDFSAVKKIAVWNFTCLFDYYPGWACPILVNFGLVESSLEA